MFIDEAVIEVKAGRGGNGCASFYRDRWMRHPVPDGGNGGDGGSVLIQADVNAHTLLDFQYRQHFTAGDGRHGSSKQQTGRRGEDRLILVPPGTLIYDADSGALIQDVTTVAPPVTVAAGGRGGVGNDTLKHRDTTPGEPGALRRLRLELKLIADVGVIGMPNAGKSSLVAAISSARPKIASYPFTTIAPVLGVVRVGETEQRFVVCDIPGLIEGAYHGRGLGHQFLRHIERTRLLVQVVDVSGQEGRDPLQDVETVVNELQRHDPALLTRPRLLLGNKMDVPGAVDHLSRLREARSEPVYAVSCTERTGLEAVVDAIGKMLKTS
ncbi:MAG: Obg family GTPase CgtA [Candidatus Omnitrophica bacterium]|nr:Obg family GTPase CgtA [Candidatus Omnitrophota bacterium]